MLYGSHLPAPPLRCITAWIAGMQRAPEAAVSSGADSSSPLLEKGLGSGSSSADAGGKPEQGASAAAQEGKVAPKVVRALLGMSAVDTPLILVAFAAGEGQLALCHDVLRSKPTMAQAISQQWLKPTMTPMSLYPCTSSLFMSSTRQAGWGALTPCFIVQGRLAVQGRFSSTAAQELDHLPADQPATVTAVGQALIDLCFEADCPLADAQALWLRWGRR